MSGLNVGTCEIFRRRPANHIDKVGCVPFIIEVQVARLYSTGSEKFVTSQPGPLAMGCDLPATKLFPGAGLVDQPTATRIFGKNMGGRSLCLVTSSYT